MESIFRPLRLDEIPEGYRLIVARTDWLNQKGIRQWPAPIPEEVIRRRQAAGGFFGYWAGKELAAVVCLLGQVPPVWGDRLQASHLYLATLASAVAYAGRGYGYQCVLAACEYARQAGYERIYLDCVDNARALPAFYQRLGFRQIAARSEPDGRQVVLMSRKLRDKSETGLHVVTT